MTVTIDAPTMPRRLPDPLDALSAPESGPDAVIVRTLPALGPVAELAEPSAELAEPAVELGESAVELGEPAVELAEPAAAVPPSSAAIPAADSPGARVEVTTVLRLVLEVLDQRRPPTQLSGRLSPSVLRYLAAAAGRISPPASRRVVPGGSRHGPPTLHSLRLSHPAHRVTEASAVWRHRGRFRALAARFEWSAGRWRCTALRLG